MNKLCVPESSGPGGATVAIKDSLGGETRPLTETADAAKNQTVLSVPQKSKTSDLDLTAD